MLRWHISHLVENVRGWKWPMLVTSGPVSIVADGGIDWPREEGLISDVSGSGDLYVRGSSA